MPKVETKFTADNKKFLKATKEMGKSMKGLGKSMSSIGKTIAKGMKNAALAIVGIGAAFTAGLNKALDFADAIGKTADQLGVSTDHLQQFRFAMNLAGASSAQADKILLKLGKSVGELKNDTGSLTTFLLKYDKSLIQAFKNTKNVEEATDLLLDVLDKESDSLQRIALANAAAGKSAVNLIPAIKDGTAAMKANMEMILKSGGVIREKFIRRAEEAKDEMALLATVIKVQLTEAFIAMAPHLTKMIEWFAENNDLMRQFVDWIARISGAVGLMSLEGLNKEMDKTTKAIFRLQAGFERPFGGKSLEQLKEYGQELAKAYDTEIARLEAQDARLKALRKGREAASKGLGGTSQDPNAKLKEIDLTRQKQEESAAAKFIEDARARRLAREEALLQLAEELILTQRLVDARKQGQDAFDEEVRAQAALNRVKQTGIEQDDVAHEQAIRTAADIELLKKELEDLGEVAKETRDPIKEMFEDLKVGTDDLAGLFRNNFQDMEDAIVGFVKTGKFDFKSMIDSMLEDLLRLAIKSALFGTEGGGGGLFGGGGGGGIFGSLLGGIFGLFSAKGNAFSGPITPFAKGGVINKQINFPIAGGIGTAGEGGRPEAILPLQRDSRGNLGVSGGGGTTITNVFNTTINPSDNQTPGQAGDFAEDFDKLIVNKIVEVQSKQVVRRGPRRIIA